MDHRGLRPLPLDGGPAVQELLGHASIATTQVYSQPDQQHLANLYDTAQPRAQRGTGAPVCRSTARGRLT
jgi:integrase/recombinase XerC